MFKLYDIENWCKKGVELINYPYIGSIKGNVSCGDTFKINGNYYRAGVFETAKKNIGVHKLDINFKGRDRQYETECICPYCGTENSNSWELPDEDDNYECESCGGIYNYSRIVTVEYTSSPVKPPKFKKREWSV